MYSYNSIEDLSDCYHLPEASDQKMAYVKCLSFLNHKTLSPTVRLFCSYIYNQCVYHHNLMKKGKLDKELFLTPYDQFYLVMSRRDISSMLSISESSASNLINEMLQLGLLEKDGKVNKKMKYLVYFPVLESDGSLTFRETPECDQEYIRKNRSKRVARLAGHPYLECSPLTPLKLRSDYTYTLIPEPVLTRTDLSPVEVLVLSCFEMSRVMSSKNAWVEEGGLLYIKRNLNNLAEELCLTPERVIKAVEHLVSKGYVYATLEDNGSQKFYLVNLYKKHPDGIDFREVLLKNVSLTSEKSAKKNFFCAKNQEESLQKNKSILLKKNIYINQYLESFSLDELNHTDADLYKMAERYADVQLSIDQKIDRIRSGNLNLNGQTFDQLCEELKIHLSFDEVAIKYVDADASKAVLTECVRILQDGSDSDLMLHVLGMDQRVFVELSFRFDQALKSNAEKGTPIRSKRAYIRKLIGCIPEIETDLLHSDRESSAKEAVYMDRLYDCQESSSTTVSSDRIASYDYDDISRDEALNTLESSILEKDTEQLWAHSVLISNPDPSSRKSTCLKRYFSGLSKSGIGSRLISGSQENRILSQNLSRKKTYEDLIQELSSEKVLIIDDLGLEQYDLFEKVLTSRLQDPEKYTLIATRLRPEEIQFRYHPRTVSRIFGGIVTR